MGKGVFGLKEEAALARTVIKKRLAGQPAPDIWFLIILMLLVCYGLVMLFSAGYAVALYRRGDAYTYIRPQLLFAAFGAAAMYAASLVDYHIWHKLAWPIMGVSLALLAIVLFMPEYNGCKRWIVLPGLGLGNSRQKYLYVPEPQNDFIFSILCEELGFVGAALTVVLFLLLFLRGMSIAVRARDKFGALLAVGFVVQVVLQAVLNIAVVTNTIPNTGISLPFFSSGGTSLMMLLGEMGIVLSVSRQADAR